MLQALWAPIERLERGFHSKVTRNTGQRRPSPRQTLVTLLDGTQRLESKNIPIIVSILHVLAAVRVCAFVSRGFRKRMDGTMLAIENIAVEVMIERRRERAFLRKQFRNEI
jgi:hypothetical protein